MGWVYLVNSAINGETLMPDDQAVVEFYQARGWEVADLPVELDPEALNTGETALPLNVIGAGDGINTGETALPIRTLNDLAAEINTGETALPITVAGDQPKVLDQEDLEDQPQPPELINEALSGDDQIEGVETPNG